jgi:nucleoside-diphosphate-sugar epimerase
MDPNDLILVTGGTGFIGGRLVEALVARGLRVRVATSDFRRCAQVSRFPIEIVEADLGDHASLVDAAAGCTVVFHAAHRFGGPDERQVNLDGTRALAEAFLNQRGRRFVYLSSIEAYGEQLDGYLTEATPRRPGREAYGNIKQDIEQALLELHHKRGMGVAILQPTIVYGPYGHFFTVRPLEELRSPCVALPKGGICNAVYVDDVVAAMMLAAERETALGETFIISGAEPTTWRQFYSAYENMLDKKAVIELDEDEMKLEERRQGRDLPLMSKILYELAKRPGLRQRLLNLPPQKWLLASGRRLLPKAARAALQRRYDRLWDIPVGPSEADRSPLLLGHAWNSIYASKYCARIEKAREKLGYNPAFDLDAGMARTADWARWSNLLST